MKKVREILRRDALAGLDGAEQLGAWLGYHGKNLRWLAPRLGVNTGTLSAVLNGSRTSAPVLERIEELTGIPADAWERKQQQ